MSQIGKTPVEIPEKVNIQVDGTYVKVEGPLGQLDFTFEKICNIEVKDNRVLVTRGDDSKRSRESHGLTRALIANMVEGVSKGFKSELTLVGVGYTAAVKGQFLLLNVGHSHTIFVSIPEGIKFETPKPTSILISGIDKQLVGQVASKIRSFRPPEPYLGKGIRYVNEYVRKKAGKKVGGK